MSDFDTDVSTSTVTDLSKRVRYSTGLVLGVDEFEQDQAYFIERDRLLTRALHGYGVVQGLDVTLDDPDDELPQVKVSPGLAVTPNGQHVCVERTQCAVIDDWLHRQDADTLIGEESDPTEICLSVVLRYGTQATDFVPIPGGPCRTEEESRAASRLADDFTLTIEPEAQRPPQVEEHAIRLLGKLLRALVVTPEPPYVEASTLTALVNALPKVLRSDASDLGAAPVADVSLSSLADTLTVDVDEDSPVRPEPGSDGDILVSVKPGTEAEMLRAILDPWVTTVRRKVLRTGHDPDDPLEAGKGAEGRCQPVPRGDDGVVLGRFCLSVQSNGDGTVQPATESGRVDVDDVAPQTNVRPQLLSTRVLQETGPFDRIRPDRKDDGGDEPDDSLRGEDATGDLAGSYPGDMVVSGLRDTDIEEFDESDLADGDLLVWNDGGNTWQHQSLQAAGDLSGTIGDPLRVEGLQQTAITDFDPDDLTEGDVLTWDEEAEEWKPVSIQTDPTPTNAERGLTRIVATSWTHDYPYTDVDALRISVENPEAYDLHANERQVSPPYALAVAFGKRAPDTEMQLGLERSGLVLSGTLGPQVFRVFFETGVTGYPNRRIDGTVFSRLRIEPDGVFPLARVGLSSYETDRRRQRLEIDQVALGTSNGGGARGALLVLPPYVEDLLSHAKDGRLHVEVWGNNILDEDRRAVDAEFVRRELPTGDRPGQFGDESDVDVGVQGGTFESWFQVPPEDAPSYPDETIDSPDPTIGESPVTTAGTGDAPDSEESASVETSSPLSSMEAEPSMEVEAQPVEPEVIDLNAADATTLTSLPNVGDTIAERIVNYRRQLGEGETIDDPFDLTTVDQLSESRIRDWEGRVEPSL